MRRALALGAVAVAIAIVFPACSSDPRRGDLMEVAFEADDIGGSRVLARGQSAIVAAGRAVKLREGAPAVRLERLEFLRIDPGLKVGPTAILDVRKNNNAIINGTCGRLPLRPERGELDSSPLAGFEVRDQRLLEFAAQIRSSRPRVRLRVEGLRIYYTIADEPDSRLFFQDFKYYFEVGPRRPDLRCKREFRAKP